MKITDHSNTKRVYVDKIQCGEVFKREGIIYMAVECLNEDSSREV